MAYDRTMSLYVILLTLHNLNRWVILIAGLVALGTHLMGWQGKQAYTPTTRRPLVAFMGALHLQFLLGFMLFAAMGMSKIPVFAGAPRGSFQWEHLGLGLLAAIFGTLGGVLSRRAETDEAKYKAAIIWAGAAYVLMLLAMPWFRPLFRLFSV